MTATATKANRCNGCPSINSRIGHRRARRAALRLRKEDRQLKLERKDPVRTRGLVRSGDGAEFEAVFEFMKVHQPPIRSG